MDYKLPVNILLQFASVFGFMDFMPTDMYIYILLFLLVCSAIIAI